MIDIVLTALLIVAVPGYMMGRSLLGRGKPPEANLVRYCRSIVLALALDGLLLVDWVQSGRAAAALGLAIPVPTPGLIGIGLAVCVLAALSGGMWRQLKSPKAPTRHASDPLPTTPREFAVFIAFALIVGVSWEVLFRGYLLWSLQPHIGLILGVLLAAAAYGVAHGFRSPRLFAGSLVSALIFTVAYAATRSLWWLMIIHCGLPLIGAVASHAQRKAAAPIRPAAP